MPLFSQSMRNDPSVLAGDLASAGTTPSAGIDPAGKEAEAGAGGRKIPGKREPDLDTYECQTCKNRKYVDGSNDPGVSFKTPTHLNPETAAYAIRSHEGEHVSHARAKAQKEDQEILSQSVSYHTSVCPECGRVYMSGGTTRTVFRSAVEEEPVEKGRYLDVKV